MTLQEYLIMVVLLTASGALAPGPLFFATIMNGVKRGARSGFCVSVGHMLVELPMVILLAFGLVSMVNSSLVKMIVGVSGGFALVGFGLYQIFRAVNPNRSSGQPEESWLLRNSIFLGIILSALNPFFIVWWFTVGSKLILEALIIASVAGVLVMYLAHVWMDYAWLTLIAALGKKSISLLGTRKYRGMLAIFGIIILYFGVGFLADSIFGVSIIP